MVAKALEPFTIGSWTILIIWKFHQGLYIQGCLTAALLIVIAFPYRRNGEIVSCKYRDINKRKRFWQESDTERILYGLDDITGASDIIIVISSLLNFPLYRST
ncbi:PREDICTED: uncharacterized protein LOC109166927 [Ipomoea nil]|uniref:uncharacterized protein LOC109166927 n=1 Tax=Ipomoea nil TaxID=35883 RepID=UPI0009010BC7|nr:PREDICTED: uncharacterized protein LOC109166927 [Ipomoea nil]